jgi:hypothetical protein
MPPEHIIGVGQGDRSDSLRMDGGDGLRQSCQLPSCGNHTSHTCRTNTDMVVEHGLEDHARSSLPVLLAELL